MEYFISFVFIVIAYYFGKYVGAKDLYQESVKAYQQFSESIRKNMTEVYFDINENEIYVYEKGSNKFLLKSSSFAELSIEIRELDKTRIYWAQQEELEKIKNYESKSI